MKQFGLYILLIAVVMVECDPGHTFIGTNVGRPLVHHKEVQYSSNLFTKRIEYYTYTLPTVMGSPIKQTIQGVLAFDRTGNSAPANVTEGGLGNNFIKLRMKSASGEKIHYDIYIYG